MLTAVSLYSGADNLGDGFIQAGNKIKICVEYNPKEPNFGKDACETIRLNHPDIEIINKPVSEVLSTLPKVDCVIGGPPCPEFSRAKSNRSFDLCEVNNFRKAIEITKAKHHFMENVQDLYQVHKERNFLINCADYGVPQTRIRRIFTDLPLPKATHSEFPTNDLFGNEIKKWVSVREALGLDGLILDKTQQCWKQKIPLYDTNKPHPTLLTDGSDNGLWYISNTGHGTQNREYITRSIDDPADTLVCASTMQITNYPIKSRKKIRNKIDKINGDGRKLTNEELAILQGFRKDFKFFGSKSSVKKQICNALPSIISKSFFLELSRMEPITV